MTKERRDDVDGAPSLDEGYQLSIEVHNTIETLYTRVEQHAANFRVMMPVDPSLPHPPGTTGGARLDPIVSALAIKAATTKRAILAVCGLGDGDNALVLARVLLENACLLEWLIRGEGRRRLEAYVMFTSVEHERIVETFDRHRDRFASAGVTSPMVSDAYHRSVWTHVFTDRGGATKSSRPTWEFDRGTGKGKPVTVSQMFLEIAEARHSFEYDVLYGALGSDIVHSGPFSLSRIMPMLHRKFILRSMPTREMCTIALATSNTAMLLVLDSLTLYVGLDLSEELTLLKAAAKSDPYGGAENRR